MRVLKNNKGFTLIEAMIVVGIIGILGALIAQLTLTGFRGWAYNLASYQIKQKVKNSRDLMINDLRYARSHTVEVSSLDATEPPFSRVTYTDVTGNARSFYQEDGKLISTYQRPGQTLTATEIIDGDLVRFHIYFPDIKDYTRLNIVLGLSRMPYKDAARPVRIDLSGKVELRNQ